MSDVYDLELVSYQEFDGYKSDLRLHMEDGTLYVLTNISFNRWYGISQNADEDDIDINMAQLLPRSIIVENKNGTLEPRVTQVTCDAIFYVFPSDEQLDHFGQWPSFTTVNAIDLDDNYSKTHVVFGQQGQIHMSEDNLFLAQSFYMPTSFSCPPNARCIEPFFRGGEQHTLVHGFALG